LNDWPRLSRHHLDLAIYIPGFPQSKIRSSNSLTFLLYLFLLLSYIFDTREMDHLP